MSARKAILVVVLLLATCFSTFAQSVETPTISVAESYTTYSYDLRGRLTATAHPDKGTTTMTYDKAGNLTHKATQKLANQGVDIEYVYDYNRLTEVHYPLLPQNNVTYTYGTTSNTGTNACGRLLRVDDGTGYQIFSYDRLGNVAENTRAIALPFEDSVYNFRMLFEYDSWNRVQRIVYPDSEVVTYNYDLGGQLCRVHTYKSGHRDTLIKNILYDEFGHRTQVNFGNGVTTNYTYDILQRLSLLETKKPSSPALQNISYSFDNEDNITRVANSTAPVNGIGGSYTFDYQYDNLYRLTSSTGNFTPTNASYYLEMGFTPAGRVCRKEQGDNNASKRLLYSYNPNNAPHAARRIYDPSTTNLRQMLWDANGNIAQIAEYLYDATNEIVNLQDFRNHYWDEDDRLNLVLDNSHFSYYLYGYDGQRVAKLTGSAFTLGTGFATNAMLDNYTLYPSEYLTITTQGYTKYYYANGTRIASKLGSGGFEKMQRLCTEDLNLTANANALFNSVVAKIGDDMPEYHISDPCPSYYSDIAGFRVQLPTLNFGPNFGITAQQNILQAFRQNYANEETYYFHGNHLGSANWVTLQNASPTQFLLHLPYGEEFVKQLNSTYDERFTFTGKEKDIETGYYYFGARFDNVDLGFMSVDPQFDKLPSTTPYNYCLWNPIILHDPDGEIPVETIWDILNVAYDLGAAAYCKIQGDDAGANEHMEDAGWDLVAVAIPYVPAGARKAVKLASKGAKAVDKGIDAAKTTKQTANLLKSTKIVNWTKNNYRRGLQLRTGKLGTGFEAHHTLPQKFEKYFSKAGINIHDPENLVWRNPHKHHTKTHEQLERWKSFFDINPNATKQEILRERNKIEKDVFGNICGDLN